MRTALGAVGGYCHASGKEAPERATVSNTAKPAVAARKATRGDSLTALKSVLIDAVPVQAMRLDRASADAVDHPYDQTAVARFNWPVHLSLRGHRRIGARRSRPLASGNGFSDWSGNQTRSTLLSRTKTCTRGTPMLARW
jgi:hypothetical protein